MEGNVTYGLRKDMLHMGSRKTCYMWLQKDILHVFRLRKDMLQMGYTYNHTVTITVTNTL